MVMAGLNDVDSHFRGNDKGSRNDNGQYGRQETNK